MRSCIEALRRGQATLLRITSMISCRGHGTCSFNLGGLNRAVTLFGRDATTTGLKRADSWDYFLFDIEGSSNVTVANMTLDEGPNAPSCTPVQRNGSYDFPCLSTIRIAGSAHIVLDQIRVLHSKNHAIELSQDRHVTIRDSTIQDSGVFGVWTGFNNALESNDILITNNDISDVKSNGLFLSYTDGTTVEGNTFRHNHRVALFNDCRGLCPGGQIDMLYNKNLSIKANIIRDGNIDLNNATGQTDGIEIDGHNADVLITNNAINNNRGPGILVDPGASFSNFVIMGNDLLSNGTAFYGVSETNIQASNNCGT